MAIDIDTTSPQYQQVLSGLNTLRTLLPPRVKFLRQLSRSQQKDYLEADIVMKHALQLAHSLRHLVHQELIRDSQ